jgi:hypothetical protein
MKLKCFVKKMPEENLVHNPDKTAIAVTSIAILLKDDLAG